MAQLMRNDLEEDRGVRIFKGGKWFEIIYAGV
jgi:hypothetical protein